MPSSRLPSSSFNDTATTEIYTLSLHDALPISTIALPAILWPPPRTESSPPLRARPRNISSRRSTDWIATVDLLRSEEHTSELQSRVDLVCRLLLEKKK